ncbi:MAG: hypothetical protein K0Q51_274 [Rickettsiaceae bacterium]|nr:hypothetical protein [Rickettsiaceae bacterium]
MINFSNLLIPPILFFLLGFIARIIKSDLEIAPSLIKTLSLYLIIGIGIKGGIELKEASLYDSLLAITVALVLGFSQPIIAYFILTKATSLDKLNSAAIAAHYGSVSVGTFLSAIAFLNIQGISFESIPLIMLAVMEFPAIFIGLILAQLARSETNITGLNTEGRSILTKILPIIKDTLTNGCVVLLVGGIIIGIIATPLSLGSVNKFYSDMFNGVLTLFLLGMGLEAATHVHSFQKVGKALFAFGILMPIFSGCIGVVIGHEILGFSLGGSILVAVLAASASYIAVPPAVLVSIPEASPSYYLTLSLGITFPFNVLIGIPLYTRVAELLIG